MQITHRKISALLLVVVGSLLMAHGDCNQEPEVEWIITNRTDETIQFTWLDGDDFYDDDRPYWANLKVGDRQYDGCVICVVEPGETWTWRDHPTKGRDVTVSARSRSTLQVIYKQVFNYKELASRNWILEITDLRKPGTEMTSEPFPQRISTLRCDECQPINPSFPAEGESFYFEGRLRTYGSTIPTLGEACHEAGIYLERLTHGEGSLRAGFGPPTGSSRGEPVPGIDDASDREAIYIYTYDGRSIDEVLIRNGVALAAGSDGQHWERLKNMEDEARENSVGCLWE